MIKVYKILISTIIMVRSNPEVLKVSPRVWPNKNLKIQPGDLSKFTPYGNGVYGVQKNPHKPIISSPQQEASGGFVYFDNNLKREDFKGFLRMMNIRSGDKDYAAFFQESSNPAEEKYFNQMRLVSKFGLRFGFDALDEREYDTFPEQGPTLEEALWGFMEGEVKKFGTSFGDPRIEGKMGGDGNFAREKLAFGFAVENEYHRVYRIWSRAWLVTK